MLLTIMLTFRDSAMKTVVARTHENKVGFVKECTQCWTIKLRLPVMTAVLRRLGFHVRLPHPMKLIPTFQSLFLVMLFQMSMPCVSRIDVVKKKSLNPTFARLSMKSTVMTLRVFV